MEIQREPAKIYRRHKRNSKTGRLGALWERVPRSNFSDIPIYILFFTIAFAPLPFGSYDRVISTSWCCLLSLCTVALSFAPMSVGSGQRRLLFGILLIVLGFIFVLHEQIADKPWIASYHPIWEKTSEVLGLTIRPSVSIVRGEPFYAVGPTIANLLALSCALIVGEDRLRARQLLMVVAWSGAAYAIYGVLSFLIEPTMLLWREKRYYLSSLTGTFVNRNTAASYLGSCSVIWLLILLERLRADLKMRPIVWRLVPNKLLEMRSRRVVVSFSLFFICLIALFLTTSRAGVALSLLALITTFFTYFRKDLPSRSGLWVVLAAGGVLSLILLQLFGGSVSSRFDVQGLADEGRIAAYVSTSRMITDFPWFGTGLGTFAWSFPAYRSPNVSINGVWDIAHNTALELASEVGIPLTLLITVGWVVAFAVLRHGILKRGRDVIIPLAALNVSLIAVLHSFVDFSLQIPGYSIVVFALLGAGLSQSLLNDENAH